MARLDGKTVLLIVGGGIAAYKALELVRLITKAGGRSRAILTRAGHEFVTPLSLAHLTGEKVHTDLFDITGEIEMGHIELSRSADLIVVAPATADLIAKMAGGRADDLASTALLATDTPVLIAPAMNVRMWHHVATQRNVERVAADGVMMIGPEEGDMACGEYGLGRMAEPETILDAIATALKNAPRALDGLRAVVTAGPTLEPIDPVRFLSNRSSGKQGYAIAEALAHAGADTTLISGPTALAPPEDPDTVQVETATEMLAAVEKSLPADIAVFTAAVADWRVANATDQKIKKSKDGTPALTPEENPDILATIAKRDANRPGLVIGFAAETADMLDHAREKLDRKGADWIVANDVSPETGVMGGDRNTVHIVRADGVEDWPTLSKDEVALKLVQAIAGHFGRGGHG